MTSVKVGSSATYKLGPKGQVVIPKQIRDHLDMKPGDRLQVREQADGVHIRKAVVDPGERRAIVASLRGALAGGPSLTAGLEGERRLEREREDRKAQGTAS
jgi:AbrB family looped-hinge helix DNA binding protein